MKKRILLLFVVLFIGSLVGCSREEPVASTSPTPVVTPTPTPEPPKYSLTTGLPVQGEPVYHPIGVMVENQQDARPQTGLQEADVIYEAMAEGDITRFLAIFNDTHPVQVGPVRSARIYYINIQREWDIPYVHFGGPEGGGAFGVEGANTNHIKVRVNGMLGKDAAYFWRSKDRRAPHNAYTDLTKINAELYHYTPAYRNQLQFGESVAWANAPSFTQVSMPFVTRNNAFVSFRYDAATGLLHRYENGKVFETITVKEANGEKSSNKAPLTVKNLIVQYADVKSAPGSTAGHRLVELTGSGRCEYFVGGKHLSGRWERSGLDAATRHFLEDGSALTLLPGNTWIALHPANKEIVVE